MAFVGVFTCLPALPASAEVLHAEQVVPGQALVVPAVVDEPEVERAVYGISYFSVVQSPVAPSARLGKPFSAGHQGYDFLPGASTPVLNIADGVVTAVGEQSGSLGVHVEIQHVIDGEVVTSTYSHLATGSMTLVLGQEVARGTQVGLVGSTGASTGPHLHFQILDANGTPINPLNWLQAHVNV
jgi:murein DD-endopeptidase MepM/ murein hydrolase activator NlpD